MKYLIYLSTIFIFFVSYACINERKEDDKNLLTKLNCIKWQSSELNSLYFDLNFVYVSKINDSQLYNKCKFSIHSDTLRIINRPEGVYNIIDFQDTISLIKIEIFSNDSLKINLLNHGAKKFFEGFSTLTFYNSNIFDRFSYYVENDSSCIMQITKAKADISKNRFVFLSYSHWPFRQKTEFETLLKQNNIIYMDLGPYPDELPIKRNCYKETMDYYIEKNYGTFFIIELMKKADILMIKNNRQKFIPYYMCDKQPYPSGSEPMKNLTYKVSIDLLSGISYNENNLIFIDIGFHIDTTGLINNFYIHDFYSSIPVKEKLKNELYKMGIEKIKKDSVWIPGEILDTKVRTDNIVRVFYK